LNKKEIGKKHVYVCRGIVRARGSSEEIMVFSKKQGISPSFIVKKRRKVGMTKGQGKLEKGGGEL